MIAGQNWYKSNCTSIVEPKIHQNLNTLYLPVNVAYDAETQMYRYEEYRMLLPIDYEIPDRVATELAFATERGAVKADKRWRYAGQGVLFGNQQSSYGRCRNLHGRRR